MLGTDELSRFRRTAMMDDTRSDWDQFGTVLDSEPQSRNGSCIGIAVRLKRVNSLTVRGLVAVDAEIKVSSAEPRTIRGSLFQSME